MSTYNGQPLIGPNNSWYVDEDGVTRNRWTGETAEQMRARFARTAAVIEQSGTANPEARAVARHLRKVAS